MICETDPRTRVAQLREVLTAAPDSPEAHLRLGTALVKSGALSEGEREFRRALELAPEMAGALVNLGGALLARWDFRGCVEANRRASERQPELMLAHYNQGLGHLYLGEAAEMAACFERVVALEPRHAGGHYYMAVAQNALGNMEGARWHLAVAMELGFKPEPELLRALEKAAGEAVPILEIGGQGGEDLPDPTRRN